MPRRNNDLAVLSGELAGIEGLLASLDEADWATVTDLEPPECGRPMWTVLQLAGHLGVGMSMLDELALNDSLAAPEYDRIRFYFPRSDVSTAAYDHAWEVTAGKTPPGEVLEYCRTNFRESVRNARRVQWSWIGPNLLRAMRVTEFVATRIIEAVVHSLDLAAALDRDYRPTVAGTVTTAALLDDLIMTLDGQRRPESLSDDLLWIRAATGRMTHHDLARPLIGR